MSRIKRAWKALITTDTAPALDWDPLATMPPGETEFLPDMTEAEYQEYLDNDVHGWQKVKKTAREIFGLV